MQPVSSTAGAEDQAVALDDVRGEFGDRWMITEITAGYRAVVRDTDGHTARRPVARTRCSPRACAS